MQGCRREGLGECTSPADGDWRRLRKGKWEEGSGEQLESVGKWSWGSVSKRFWADTPSVSRISPAVPDTRCGERWYGLISPHHGDPEKAGVM